MNVFLWNARARNTDVEATLNHPFPAQASSVYAALANEVCEGAIAGLAHGRLRIRARALAGDACEQHLSAAEEVLAIASDQLDIINRANDARVLGVRADLSVVISLVTAGLSAYVFVLFLLFDVST